MRAVELTRSGVYRSKPVAGADDLAAMRRIDELQLELPFYGSRRMTFELNKESRGVNRKRVRRLMRVMGSRRWFRAPARAKPRPGTRSTPTDKLKRTGGVFRESANDPGWSWDTLTPFICANLWIGTGNAERSMSTKRLPFYAVVALVGVAMISVSVEPVSAFTLASSSLLSPNASAQIEKVWWRGGWGRGGWGRGGWGGGWRGGWGWRRGWGWRGGYWGPGAVIGGLAAGAVVGAAVAGGGPCWRRVVGPYGVFWRRVC
jgi:HTH-like domain